MLIIWRGAGAVVFILGILAALVTNIVTSRVFDENNYFQTHPSQAVALWLTGTVCWFLGRFLHSRPGQVVIDKDTGLAVTVRPEHSLFFIKLEYWGPILFVIGLCVLLFAR